VTGEAAVGPRDGRLDGRVALVTGGGQTPGANIGNGRATAILLAGRGASVVVLDRDEASAAETARMITAEGGSAVALPGDVTSASDWRTAAAACLDGYGRLDVVHHNVGIGTPPRSAPPGDSSPGGAAAGARPPDASPGGSAEPGDAAPGGSAEPGGAAESGGAGEPGRTVGAGDGDGAELDGWGAVMAVNAGSAVLMARAVLPAMRDAGRGVITIVSSIAAVTATTSARANTPIAYRMSKAALNSYTRALAMENARHGIRVNAIMPGLIDTPMGVDTAARARGIDRDAYAARRDEAVPLRGGMGSAWDVAHAAAFLAGDEAAFITGVVLAVDGGQSARSG
jgi:NAD(P)-dependent dehydrogenase (short-subunit alcohol dehydrogenase family)